MVDCWQFSLSHGCRKIPGYFWYVKNVAGQSKFWFVMVLYVFQLLVDSPMWKHEHLADLSISSVPLIHFQAAAFLLVLSVGLHKTILSYFPVTIHFVRSFDPWSYLYNTHFTSVSCNLRCEWFVSATFATENPQPSSWFLPASVCFCHWSLWAVLSQMQDFITGAF